MQVRCRWGEVVFGIPMVFPSLTFFLVCIITSSEGKKQKPQLPVKDEGASLAKIKETSRFLSLSGQSGLTTPSSVLIEFVLSSFILSKQKGCQPPFAVSKDKELFGLSKHRINYLPVQDVVLIQ
jgi:hypothetical protein